MWVKKDIDSSKLADGLVDKFAVFGHLQRDGLIRNRCELNRLSRRSFQLPLYKAPRRDALGGGCVLSRLHHLLLPLAFLRRDETSPTRTPRFFESPQPSHRLTSS